MKVPSRNWIIWMLSLTPSDASAVPTVRRMRFSEPFGVIDCTRCTVVVAGPTAVLPYCWLICIAPLMMRLRGGEAGAGDEVPGIWTHCPLAGVPGVSSYQIENAP